MTPAFPIVSRVLHWVMAALILAMLFIGVSMVASLAAYHRLVSIHEPLGLAILALAVVRLVNRFVNRPPPLPEAMPPLLKLVAHGSHWVLYALMLALPLIGWAMLSAARYPIEIGALTLPPILPPNAALYATLRTLHGALAWTLFAVVLAHLSAALMHALIFKDGVFASMTSSKV
jgi:cytochrome b561